MRCCVPFCEESREEQSIKDLIVQPVTFHEFPTTECVRNSWMQSLDIEESYLPDGAQVCSQHFQEDHFYVTEHGLRELRNSAVPSLFRFHRKIDSAYLQVCLICLDTASKMSSLCKYNLTEAYINVTGLSVNSIQKLNCEPKLCTECAHRLLNCNKFRDKCLRGNKLLKQMADKHGTLTIQNMKTIDRVDNNLTSNIVKHIIEPDHCDLYLKDGLEENDLIREQNKDHSEQHIKIKIERDDDTILDSEVKEEILEIDIDCKSIYLSDLDAVQVTNNDAQVINIDNVKDDDVKNHYKSWDEKVTNNDSINNQVKEADIKEANFDLDIDIDDEPDDCNGDDLCKISVKISKENDNNKSQVLTDNSDSEGEYLNDKMTSKVNKTITPSVCSDDIKNRYRSDVRGVAQKRQHSKIKKIKNEEWTLAGGRDNLESKEIINDYDKNAVINIKVEGLDDDDDCNMELVNDYDDYVTFLNENHNKNSEVTINNNESTSNKAYLLPRGDKVSLNNVIFVKTKSPIPQLNSDKNCPPNRDSDEQVKNKLTKPRVTTNKVNPKNKDKGSSSKVELVKGKKGAPKTVLKLFQVTELTREEQLAEVRQRMESKNYVNAVYRCTICYKGFVNRNAFNLHSESHTNKFGPLVCPVCGVHTFTMKVLRLHIKNNHLHRFSCTVCSFVTKHAQMASLHERWHGGIKYTCEHCGMEFSKHTSYMTHVRLKHPSDVICALCGFSFINARGLMAHMRKSHRFADNGQKLNGPLCEICNIRFADVAAYEQHVTVSPKHSNTDPTKRNNQYCNADKRTAVCEQCGAQVKGSRGLLLHINKHHRMQHIKCEENAICEHCGRVCPSKQHLRSHLIIHMQKRFQCDICQKSFSLKTNLAIHMGLHSASRPQHECPSCGRGFSHKQNMRRHILTTHDEKRPLYKCKICDKTMTTAKSRDSHILHVHNNVPRPKRLRRPRHCPKASGTRQVRHAIDKSESQSTE